MLFFPKSLYTFHANKRWNHKFLSCILSEVVTRDWMHLESKVVSEALKKHHNTFAQILLDYSIVSILHRIHKTWTHWRMSAQLSVCGSLGTEEAWRNATSVVYHVHDTASASKRVCVCDVLARLLPLSSGLSVKTTCRFDRLLKVCDGGVRKSGWSLRHPAVWAPVCECVCECVYSALI